MAEQRLSRISSRADTKDVRDGQGEKRHTIYYMNIEVGNNKYYLHKRYTDFLMLHQKLCEQQYPEVEDFDFPRKVWFNTFSEQVIEYRRTKFEHYISLLLSLSARYPGIKKELESFLGVPRQIDRGAKRYPKTPKPSLNHPTPARLFADDSPTHGGSQGGAQFTLLSEPTPRTKVNLALLIYSYISMVALLSLWGAMDPGQARTSANAILVLTVGTLWYGYRATYNSIARMRRRAVA